MLFNYFRIAVRNLQKDKVFSVINITGLAVGITCFLALFLFVQDELGYDSFHLKKDRIYRVFVRQYINGDRQTNSKTSGQLGPSVLNSFPEVESFVRLGYDGPKTFKYYDKIYRTGRIYTADSTLFDVFTYRILKGDAKKALNSPDKLVLTESTARSFFGDINAVGKTVSADNGKFYLISAVIKDFPKNSHFSCDMFESMSSYQVSENWMDLWYTTYLLLKPGTDARAFERKLQKTVEEYVGPAAEKLLGVSMSDFQARGNVYNFGLQPVQSVYLNSLREYNIDMNTEWSDIKSGDSIYVYIFSAVAVFILLLAVINFMNLSTARSEKRAREVGIRKTLGSNKSKLIAQFISEAVFMSFLAVIIASALLEVVLPFFNNISGKNLRLDYFGSIYTIPLMVLFIAAVGILAGSYPAFYLSSFKPVQVLKNKTAGRGSRKNLRSILVIAQFAISITLLIATLITYNQLQYILNKDLGFNKEYLLSILDLRQLGNKVEVLKQDLLKNAAIISCTNSTRMFDPGIPGSGYFFNKKTGDDPILVKFVNADYDFLKTYGMKLKAGRYFSKDFSSDSVAALINESALRMFRAKEWEGKFITSLDARELGTSYNIIGILKDFNYESLHSNVMPLVVRLNIPGQPANSLTIRMSSKNIKETVSYVENLWKKFVPENGMYYTFVDQQIQRLYDAEEKTSVIATVFSGLAIFIACLGLFGLAAFVTEQRTKEIGIRKVLGASIPEIIMLLSRQFIVWVLIANIIAWPVAYYAMRQWLQNFAYRINLSPVVFILPAILALTIALITVGMHAFRAAKANPVNSLKYE